MLEFVKAEGVVDWDVTDKGTKLMAVWASDSEVLLKNDERRHYLCGTCHRQTQSLVL